MSKSRKPAGKKSVEVKPSGPFAFLKDGRFRKIVGILLLVFTVYLAIATASYFFSWKTDQDQVMNRSLTEMLSAPEPPVQNQGGRLGAWLSHQLIYNGFGIASGILLYLLGALSIQLLFRRRLISVLKTLAYSLLILLFASPVLAFFFQSERFQFPFGGRFGNQVIEKLNSTAGTIGTTSIIIALCLIVLVLIFNPVLSMAFWKKGLPTASPTPVASANQALPAEALSPAQEAFSQSWPLEAQEDQTIRPQLQIDDSFFEPEPIEETDPIPERTTEETPTPQVSTAVEFELESEPPTPQETMKDLDFEVHTAEEKQDILPLQTGMSVASEEPYDPSLELRNYKFPTLDLLENRSTQDISVDKNELEQNKNQIINTLKSFGIAIAKISATVGPTVTLYEIVPAEGVRISKIRNLEDDIALSLSALGIRIIAPIPGKGTIGIEVPNMKKQIVNMRTLIASEKFVNNDFSLPIALGKRIDNENYIVDLAKMPHLLMAGATGQGKSVGINTILVSLLYKKHPSQLKFVMVDPKKVELSIYKLIEKHFLAKLPNEEDAIITDTKKVINTLNALCIEMDNRYDLLKEAGVRNIKEYNEKFIKRRLNPNKGHQYLPFIVLVVDEFADLIMTAGKEVEMPIARLAQLARAVGIHLIIATQRPSVNVITGTIKANFPARVAFRVSAKVDSRTILDAGGAEQLIGQGDMLILNGSELVRLQCAFVDTPEVERIVEFIGTQQGYPSAFDLPEYEGSDNLDMGGSGSKSLKDVDSMFEQCARLVVSSGSGSTSMLQRRFNLGYNRAGRIMDQMEAAGIVGSSIGGKARELLVHSEMELEEILKNILP
ncbi:MAG: DNA translocase FtsK [Chitinophagaceae bacterium]|nr:DNA translocase FtsK [Chitinophagaceae bacterium]